MVSNYPLRHFIIRKRQRIPSDKSNSTRLYDKSPIIYLCPSRRPKTPRMQSDDCTRGCKSGPHRPESVIEYAHRDDGIPVLRSGVQYTSTRTAASLACSTTSSNFTSFAFCLRHGNARSPSAAVVTLRRPLAHHFFA